MQVVVPFALENPKTRLSSILSPGERETVARAMLVDVLDALNAAGADPAVLTTGPLDLELDHGRDVQVPTIVDERPLTAAVNGALEDAFGDGEGDDTETAVAIVMADLALATPRSLERLFSTEGDVVIAPGRGGGTNALIVRQPEFRVDYHGASYLDHRKRARAVSATVSTVDSFRLSTDVDEPEDLVEVLLHTDGRTRAILEELGLELAVRDGRVGVDRRETDTDTGTGTDNETDTDTDA